MPRMPVFRPRSRISRLCCWHLRQLRARCRRHRHRHRHRHQRYRASRRQCRPLSHPLRLSRNLLRYWCHRSNRSRRLLRLRAPAGRPLLQRRLCLNQPSRPVHVLWLKCSVANRVFVSRRVSRVIRPRRAAEINRGLFCWRCAWMSWGGSAASMCCAPLALRALIVRRCRLLLHGASTLKPQTARPCLAESISRSSLP